MPRKPKEEKKKRVRVNIRLPVDLVEWAKEYADARNTTFTQVVVDNLTVLKSEETV